MMKSMIAGKRRKKCYELLDKVVVAGFAFLDKRNELK